MKKLLLLLLLPSTAFAYVVKESKLNEPISFYVNDGTVKKGMEILATGVVDFPFGTTNAIPDASPSVAGRVSTGAQSFGGVKTFNSTPVFSAMPAGVVKSVSGTLSASAVVNGDVDASAAIATSKLSGAVTSITGNGLGAAALIGTPISLANGGTAGTSALTARSNLQTTVVTSYAIMSAVCTTGTCALSTNLGGGISSITHAGTLGKYNINHTGSFWSDLPFCSAGPVEDYGADHYVCVNLAVPTTSLSVIACTTAAGSSAANLRIGVSCVGERN